MSANDLSACRTKVYSTYVQYLEFKAKFTEIVSYAVCCCCIVVVCQPFSCWLCRKAHGNRIANALTAECLVECRMCRKTFNKSRDWPCCCTLCGTHTHFHDLWLPSNQNYDKYCQRHNRPGIWCFYLIKKLYRLSFDSFLPSSAFPAVSAAYSIL